MLLRLHKKFHPGLKEKPSCLLENNFTAHACVPFTAHAEMVAWIFQ